MLAKSFHGFSYVMMLEDVKAPWAPYPIKPRWSSGSLRQCSLEISVLVVLATFLIDKTKLT